MPIQMRHVIILLPGIMGSALQKDGKDVWALSGQALWQYLSTLGNSIEQLRIIDDDWERDDIGDGIRAARLLEDMYSIPLLVEHAGYSVIIRRIKEYFDVNEGSIFKPREDANFFTFPYDWRRDDRASARKLQLFIEKQLPAWRKSSGADDAQVLLIGHSMGGLIARYYLEVMGGWLDCRALITVGSPHRGAVKVLDLLSNGLIFRNLTNLLRTFRSAYQIMPTYPIVKVDGNYVRISETSAIPNIDQQLAKDSRDEFLDAIRQAAIQNGKVSGYQQRTIPWIGTRQDTHQSARLNADGKLILSYDPPPGVAPDQADGDGSVPQVSALPVDLDQEMQTYSRFSVERHGWLTNNDMTLEPLLETLRQHAAPWTQPVFGGRMPGVSRSSINLRLESLFLPGEPVTMQAKLVSTSDQPQNVSIRIESIGHRGVGADKVIQANPAEATVAEFGELTPGLYQVTASPESSGLQAPLPIHGVFEVVDPIALD